MADREYGNDVEVAAFYERMRNDWPPDRPDPAEYEDPAEWDYPLEEWLLDEENGS